jgi:tetratricopeptide (TPR) repeat protein
VVIGVVHTKRWKQDAALQAFLKAMEANPTNAEAHRWAARQYSDRGDLLSEYRMIKAAFAAASSDPYYADLLDHLLTRKLGDYQQALAFNRELLARSPDDASTLKRLGALHVSLGDLPQGLEHYRRAAAKNPLDPETHEHLGYAVRRAGQPDRALAAFRQAASLDPTRSEPYLGMASVHHDQRRWGAAVSEYERAFRLGRVPSADHLATLCALYYRTSAFERAETCFKRVLAMDPNHVGARRLLPEVEQNLALERARR